mmetsp:Transcript_86327/g.252611  ORF Transcript_86327/g.252611 Transcript_86327/m.252611 type:complete len:291 (-) Transcript_86327:988-1860(-)
MENGPRRKRMRSPWGMETSSQRHNKGSQAQNSASTKSMTSSSGFDSKPSIRSSCLCSRSKKASTRRAQVLTMPSKSSKARETSSIAGSSVKSGMGGGSVLAFSFGFPEPLEEARCCALAAWTSRPFAETFPCSPGLTTSPAAWSSSGSKSTASCAPSSCTLHLPLDLSNSTRSPCFPLASTTTRWPADSAWPDNRELAASGTASRFSGPSDNFWPLFKRTAHCCSCWSSSSRSPCFPFSSGTSCRPWSTTRRPGASAASSAPADLSSLAAGALRSWRRRIHSSSSVRRKL